MNIANGREKTKRKDKDLQRRSVIKSETVCDEQRKIEKNEKGVQKIGEIADATQ